MKKSFVYYILILIFLPIMSIYGSTIFPKAEKGIIDLSFMQRSRVLVPLDGEWGFHWKNLLIEIPAKEQSWINVPGNWAATDVYPVSGYATYTLRLKGLVPGTMYEFYIPESISAYRMFLGGSEIASNGTVGMDRMTSRPSFRPETVLFKAESSSYELILQVSNFHYRKSGIWRSFYIGHPHELTSYRLRKIILETFLIGLITFVSISHLSLYFFRNEEKPELFFGLICLIFLFRLLTTGEQLLTYFIPHFPWEMARRMEFLPFSGASGLMVFYFRSLYPIEFNIKYLKIYLIGASLFMFIFLILPVRISNNFIPLGELYLFAGIIYCLVITLRAFKAKRNGALLILVSVGIVFISVLNDILYSNQIIQSIYMAPLGFVVFIITQSLMLSRRFSYSFRTIENLTVNLKDFNKSLSRFVPFQFLEYLNKESILQVELGDQALKNMTILFADIRSFTTLSEVLTPEENFRFLNSFLSQVVPVIREGGGFVDKFIGDGIMALFPNATDNGIKTAINMQLAVQKYNEARKRAGYIDIKLGVGVHRGSLILGTIGETDRMETTVISDTVNVASRMEMLTKQYGASIIISKDMYLSLENPEEINVRNLGSAKVKGKRNLISLYEVLDGLPPREFELKQETKKIFEEGVMLFEALKINEARISFHQVLNRNPSDTASSFFISKCSEIEGMIEE